MTALERYARLESGGIWRPDAASQRRDVVVSFGDATLVLSDGAGRPLTHWSLPAITRLNPGERPALFSPDPAQVETLEIAEDEMIDALEKVRKTVERRRGRPGRLRAYSGLAIVGAIAAMGLFWLPNALTRQTLDAVRESKRTEIGATILGHVQRLTGPSCRSPAGSSALSRLTERTLGAGTGAQVVVLPVNHVSPRLLPGGLIVLNRTVVEDHEDPAVAAGHILAAATQVQTTDPLEPVLRRAGPFETFRLFTTGSLSDEVLATYAKEVVADRPAPLPDDLLLGVFQTANLPSTPFAYALDPTGETTLRLIEADPLAGRPAPQLMPDADWVRLQNICSD